MVVSDEARQRTAVGVKRAKVQVPHVRRQRTAARGRMRAGPRPVWALPAAYDRPPAGGEAARRVALALRPPAAAGGPTGLHDALVNGGLHAYCSRAHHYCPARWLAGWPAASRGPWTRRVCPTTRTRTRRGGACRGWTGLIRARWRRRGRGRAGQPGRNIAVPATSPDGDVFFF